MVVWPSALAGGEAAEAGDEAVAVGAGGVGRCELPDLDRQAEAFGRDGKLQLAEGGFVQRRAVAEEGGGVDLAMGRWWRVSMGGSCCARRVRAGW